MSNLLKTEARLCGYTPTDEEPRIFERADRSGMPHSIRVDHAETHAQLRSELLRLYADIGRECGLPWRYNENSLPMILHGNTLATFRDPLSSVDDALVLADAVAREVGPAAYEKLIDFAPVDSKGKPTVSAGWWLLRLARDNPTRARAISAGAARAYQQHKENGQ